MFAFILLDEFVYNGFFGFFARHTVKFLTVNGNSVLRKGKIVVFAVFAFDDANDGKVVFLRKDKVSFVVRGNAHDCARTVRI